MARSRFAYRAPCGELGPRFNPTDVYSCVAPALAPGLKAVRYWGLLIVGFLEVVIELRSTGVDPEILGSVRGLLREYSARGNGLCGEIPTSLVMLASKAQMRCMPMY